jgi:hypothetical protein
MSCQQCRRIATRCPGVQAQVKSEVAPHDTDEAGPGRRMTTSTPLPAALTARALTQHTACAARILAHLRLHAITVLTRLVGSPLPLSPTRVTPSRSRSASSATAVARHSRRYGVGAAEGQRVRTVRRRLPPRRRPHATASGIGERAPWPIVVLERCAVMAVRGDAGRLIRGFGVRVLAAPVSPGQHLADLGFALFKIVFMIA